MPRQVSEKPSAVRKRLKKGSEQMSRDLMLHYKKPVEQWDFEELQRGRPRDEDGGFSRRGRPDWITPAILNEAQRRLKTLAMSELSMYAGEAIKVMAELMQQAESDSVRFQAAKYMMDQIIGTPKASVEVEGSIAMNQMLADVVVNADGQPSHDIVDADWEEDDDE